MGGITRKCVRTTRVFNMNSTDEKMTENVIVVNSKCNKVSLKIACIDCSL